MALGVLALERGIEDVNAPERGGIYRDGKSTEIFHLDLIPDNCKSLRPTNI